MTRQQLLDKPDFFNLVHGITLRAIQTFADNELHHREGPEDTGATDEERCVRTVSHDPPKCWSNTIAYWVTLRNIVVAGSR